MKKSKKAIIFGLGLFGEVVDFYLTHDSEYEVIAFTATQGYTSSVFCGKPVIPFEEIEYIYSPNDHEIFIAIGQKNMNKTREDFVIKAKEKGYKPLSYICSKAIFWGDKKTIGENVFIFENNVIQPFVTIGDGTILWSGNHIGHHSKVGRYCFITSHVVISGSCTIGDYCFIGVNATFHDGITVGNSNVLGARSLITKDTTDNEVYRENPSEKMKITSERMFK